MICGSVRKLEEDEGDEEVGGPKTSEKSKSGSVEGGEDEEEESGILRWVSLLASME